MAFGEDDDTSGTAWPDADFLQRADERVEFAGVVVVEAVDKLFEAHQGLVFRPRCALRRDVDGEALAAVGHSLGQCSV